MRYAVETVPAGEYMPAQHPNQCIDVDAIPTLPSIAIEAMRLMEGENSSFDSIADLLKNDQVLASKILHYANSAYVGVRKISSISQAISFLGFNAVRSIILSATIFDTFSDQFSSQRSGLINFWMHSIGVAATAEILAKKLAFPDPEVAYLGGLLHDLGKLVSYIQFPQEFAKLCRELENQGTYSTKGNLPLDIEKACLNTTHLDIGRIVAERWQLPESIGNVLWLHHQPVPDAIIPDEINLPQLIRFADVLCVVSNIGSSYFLSEGPYCHEHYHFALESLLLHHHFTPEDIDAIIAEVLERTKEIGNILGFWDEEVYRQLVSSANVSLGSISMKLDKDNRRLEDTNRVLSATVAMTRELNAGLSLSEAARIVAKAAAKALGASRSLCMIRDEAARRFVGQLFSEDTFLEFHVPVPPQEMRRYVQEEGLSDIESEAVQRLEQTTLDVVKGGGSPESGIINMVAGSRFLASFFIADKSSNRRKIPVIGELMLDFSDAEQMEADSPANMKGRFEALALAAGNSIERLLLEADYARQTKEMTEASRKIEENQRQLFHSHRLATVGQLAAGAAHEINNPLTIISLNIQIMERLLSERKEETELADRLKTISGQERRISKIIQDLMGFARPSQPKFCPSVVDEILEKVLAVIGDRVTMTDIRIETKVPKDLPRVMVDPLQIEQVIMNLLVNASHAMPDGGRISIAAQARENYVEIRVVDTGQGISRENLNKIFDPFFTTKKEGEGTGLGLAICNSIIEHNGGMLKVHSDGKTGTTFTMTLPVDKGGRLRALKKVIEKKKKGAAAVRPEKYRILVIDDEKILNDMLRESLREAGYEADGAYDGVEGIGLLRYKKYHMILLDIRMPRKDGLEVLQFVRENYPNVKVVIITGLASKKEVQETVKMGAFACLKKPFRLENVLKTIQQALNT